MARDIEADYRRAYLEQYQRARTAGRTAEADRIAAVLRARFGHDPAPAAVAPESGEGPPRRARGPKTRAAAEPLPETTAAD
ncbi:hypothetical protein [Nocardia terpenica]|uniref:Uncharacterized protein n=1 Tax=Nocardia terpenica TaxID=455432 RepID=A0A164HAS2_9NOCA|nr:hypothetical protein [Nocardia terpenica]KZM68350.1 hypothetical protein AWN90_10710 [Nocardia terpenica]NQE88736.1 hypothetical protein [Nocardia terpenica]